MDPSSDVTRLRDDDNAVARSLLNTYSCVFSMPLHSALQPSRARIVRPKPASQMTSRCALCDGQDSPSLASSQYGTALIVGDPVQGSFPHRTGPPYASPVAQPRVSQALTSRAHGCAAPFPTHVAASLSVVHCGLQMKQSLANLFVCLYLERSTGEVCRHRPTFATAQTFHDR